jgi:hypothetical protein
VQMHLFCQVPHIVEVLFYIIIVIILSRLNRNFCWWLLEVEKGTNFATIGNSSSKLLSSSDAGPCHLGPTSQMCSASAAPAAIADGGRATVSNKKNL